MTATEVLAELDRLGLRCEVADGTRLLVHGSIPAPLIEQIRALKPEILASLSERRAGDVPDLPEVPDAPGVPGAGEPGQQEMAGLDAAEIERRVQSFREQYRVWSEAGRPGTPFFVMVGVPEDPSPDICVSCGGPRGKALPPPGITLRCQPCREALHLVLAEIEAREAGRSRA